ncbi:MAG: DNA polymerase III subunit beta [Bacteroidales bacterium]|nr:DNA polymerase III subunit beta [Bacteroidales bacterium]
MKFHVPSKTLYSVASGVSKVINAKNALAVLNNFHLAVADDKLTITGSDVENALMGTIPLTEVEGEGSFCIDARRLVDFLKEIPDQPIEIEVNEETLEMTIQCDGGNGRFEWVATPGDQYPQYKEEEDAGEPMTFNCPAEQLLKGIDNTIFAVGNDDFHPQMMGILLDIKADGITFVATDTRKLVRFINKNVAPGVEARRILPYKPAQILKGVFGRDDELEITFTAKSATIRSSVYVFNCRFIKGNFPPYDRVIPQNNPYVMRIDRLSFLNRVRRVGVFVDAGFGLEKLKITNDRIYLKADDPNMQTKGIESLACEYNGSDLVIGFSAPFLAEICNGLPTEEILVKLSDPSRPGVFCPTENEEGTDLLMLLMPMNVSEF